jgi:hypothetical protein
VGGKRQALCLLNISREDCVSKCLEWLSCPVRSLELCARGILGRTMFRCFKDFPFFTIPARVEPIQEAEKVPSHRTCARSPAVTPWADIGSCASGGKKEGGAGSPSVWPVVVGHTNQTWSQFYYKYSAGVLNLHVRYSPEHAWCVHVRSANDGSLDRRTYRYIRKQFCRQLSVCPSVRRSTPLHSLIVLFQTTLFLISTNSLSCRGAPSLVCY